MGEAVSVDFLYKDHAGVTPVYLIVQAKSAHSFIDWVVGRKDNLDKVSLNDYVRRIHVVHELGHPHLTNHGPVTVSASKTFYQNVVHLLGILTLAQRQALERLSLEEPVRSPDGQWACRAWTRSLLEKAAQQGILDPARVREGVELMMASRKAQA